MTQDTRKDRRVKIVSLNVRYKSATVDEFIENHAHDVSRGGIFIKTANPFPPGTLLKFEIRLASDQAVIAGVGRIVWKRDAGVTTGERPAGMGVKFIKIDEPSKAVIDRLVNTREDAGKSFETTGEVTEAPVQTRSTPPARRASGTSPAAGSAPNQSAAPRSATPAAGMTAAPSSTEFRKATMLGLGVAGTEASASPGSPSPAPPGRTPFSSHPSAPPRPGGGGGAAMFPAGDAEGSMPPKEDQTVMRQAAELLEDALREAGGSMAEIGTNPLFSGSGPAPSEPTAGEARVAISTTTPASEWTTADTPQALAATVAALRAEEAASHPTADSRRSDAARIASETPTSSRSASAVTIEKGKSSAGTLLVVGIAAVFAIAGAVLFRDQLFGGGAAQEPVAAPTSSPAASAPPMPSVTSMASVTTVTIPPAETAASAPSQRPAPAAPTASAMAGAATASPSAAGASASPSASAMASAAGVIATALPRIARPAPTRPAAPAGDDNSAGVAPTETGGSAVARPAAPAAKPVPPPAKPAPPPKATPEKPTDDNPY